MGDSTYHGGEPDNCRIQTDTGDNQRIITMEWMAEGITLVFIGSLVYLAMLTGGASDPVAIVMIQASAVMLLILAGLSAVTGARTAATPMRICPFVKTVCALSFIAGTIH